MLNIEQCRKNNEFFLATGFDSASHLGALSRSISERRQTSRKFFLKTSHANIVNLLGAFLDGKIIHLAYEEVEVSLRELSYVPLGQAQISFICKEVRLRSISPICPDVSH
jgi:hypothetical protein